MIIVDDASTDNPESIISKYVGDKIRYIKLNKNMGYSHAKNVGIKNAKADIISMLDADDMFTKNSLIVRYNKILEGYDFVHGVAINLKNNKKEIDRKRFDRWVSSKKDHSCYKLIHAQTVMLRKKIHSEIGLYDETMRCKSDREMWARILARPQYKISCVDQPVCIYRIHDKQMHKSKQKVQNNKELESEAIKRISLRRYDLSDLEMLKIE